MKKGYYGSTGGLTSSTCSGACTSGTQSSAGATECTTCLAGSYQSGATCISCSVGYYSLAGATVCTICAKGTYGEASGLSACTSCTAGKNKINN